MLKSNMPAESSSFSIRATPRFRFDSTLGDIGFGGLTLRSSNGTDLDDSHLSALANRLAGRLAIRTRPVLEIAEPDISPPAHSQLSVRRGVAWFANL